MPANFPGVLHLRTKIPHFGVTRTNVCVEVERSYDMEGIAIHVVLFSYSAERARRSGAVLFEL